MKNKGKQGALAQVRAARRQISKQFDHDPRKLIEYYMKLQQQYRDRLVGNEDEASEKAA